MKDDNTEVMKSIGAFFIGLSGGMSLLSIFGTKKVEDKNKIMAISGLFLIVGLVLIFMTLKKKTPETVKQIQAEAHQ